MKNLNQRIWWVIIPIFLLVVIISIPKCTANLAEKTFTQSEQQTALNKLKQELDAKYLNQLADSSELIQEQNKKISDGLKPVIKWKTAKAKQSVEAARKDTNTTVLANQAIDNQEEVIFDLNLKAYHDSIQLAECNKQKIIKDSLIESSNKAFTNELLINSDLQKAVKRNFIEKNGVFIGAGITASALLAVKLLIMK